MNKLSTRLYAAMSSPALRDTRRSSTSAHASSASIRVPNVLGGEDTIGACNRQQYYRMTHVSPTDVGETDWSISALLGEKCHDLANELIIQYGIPMGLQMVGTEHSFHDPRINLSARSDILVWDHWENELAGIEVKSVGEYKAGMCITEPAKEHVMQSMLYLDYYQNYIPAGQSAPRKWYIWYISRTENWTLKGKKHGSPFAMLWDFYITLEGEDGVPLIHTDEGVIRWKDFSVKKIHERYHDLAKAVEDNWIPERDYDLRYSEEKIAGLYKHDRIKYKKDKEPIKKWLDKGGKAGELKVELGDFECRVCPWKSHCWNLTSTNTTTTKSFNLPLTKEQNTQESNSDIIL